MNHRVRRRIVIVGSLLVGCVTLIAVAAVARTWFVESRRAAWRAEGLAAFEAKDYEAASNVLGRVVASTEDNEVRLAFAESRLRVPLSGQRHLRVAARVFALVEATEPDNVRALLGRLDCMTRLGFLSEMRSIAERILATNPSSVKAREALMQVGFEQGRWQEALEQARALQAAEPEIVRWRAAEVVCLSASGMEASEILALVRSWVAMLPESTELRILEAEILGQTGDRAGARSILLEICERGTDRVETLEALIAALETLGLPDEIDRAITNSVESLGDSEALRRIDSERLIRSGRLALLAERYGKVDPTTVPGFRIRFAIEYLSGRATEAYALLSSRASTVDDRAEPLLAAARAAFSEGGARRIDEVAQAARDSAGDPLVSIILAETLAGLGDVNAGLSTLSNAFAWSGRKHQPAGIRAVRMAANAGRVPLALEIARDLGIQYPKDPAVGLAILEAWAKALEFQYRPSFAYGVLAQDDTRAFREFWEGLGRPKDLAAPVARVLASRGDRKSAKVILDEFGVHADSVRLAIEFIPIGAMVGPEMQKLVLDRAVELEPSGIDAIIVAEQLRLADRPSDAISLLEMAVKRAESDADRRRVERWRRVMTSDGRESMEWLDGELKADPTLETAEFVLSRLELWEDAGPRRAKYLAIIDAAIAVIRDVAGAGSPRCILSQAARDLVFSGDDPATVTRVTATLSAFEKAWPDSVAGRILYGRALELSVPPDFVRASAVLGRAVELEPGRMDLYPDLARMLQRIGDYSGASLAIETYARLAGGDPESARLMAQMRESIGQFNEAAVIRASITERTRSLFDRLATIQSKTKAGKFDEAEADLRTLLEEIPDAYVGRELADLLARRGRLVEARELLADISRSIPGVPIDTLLAELELQHGSSEIALAAALRAVESQPGNPSDLILARVYLRLGEVERARVPLLRAIERAPKDPTLLPVASAVLIADSSEEAKSTLARALESGETALPELVEAVRLVSQAIDEQGRLSPVAEHLRAARELTTRFPNSAILYNVAAQVHLAAGVAEEAARLALLGHSRLPLEESMAELAVALCSNVGRIDDAAAALSAWRRIPGASSARIDASEAGLALVRGNPERALALLAPHVEVALANDASLDSIGNYLRALVLLGRADDVDRFIGRVGPALRPTVMSTVLDTTVGLDAAVAHPIVRIVRKHGAGELEQLVRASVYMTALCRDGVRDACDDATALLAEVRGAIGERADVLDAELLEARGDLSLAEEAYRAILRRALGTAADDPAALLARVRAVPPDVQQLMQRPEVVPAMNNLARTLVSSGRGTALAVGYSQVLHEIFPKSSAMLETYVSALVSDGRPAEARSVARGCDDPLVRDLLVAETSLRLGDLIECRGAATAVAATFATLPVVPRPARDRLAAVQSELDQLMNESQQGSEG